MIRIFELLAMVCAALGLLLVLASGFVPLPDSARIALSLFGIGVAVTTACAAVVERGAQNARRRDL